MKLVYHKGTTLNFGDDLNPWLWPRLLPHFFDEDESQVFIGIGSILSGNFIHSYGPSTQKIVFGTGFVRDYYPEIGNKDDQHSKFQGPDWKFYFVRGPRTAAKLQLPPYLAIGDSAILVRTLSLPKPQTLSYPVSFMPHWESMERGHWQRVCELANIKLIDPRRSVDEILADLQASRLLITEAMHGAIVADALRIPWIPVLPLNKIHREKWFDWAESLGLSLNCHRIVPSSLQEARLSFLHRPLTQSPFMPLLDKGLVQLAAISLQRLSRVTSMLSDDRAIDNATGQMLDCLEQLKNKRT